MKNCCRTQSSNHTSGQQLYSVETAEPGDHSLRRRTGPWYFPDQRILEIAIGYRARALQASRMRAGPHDQRPVERVIVIVRQCDRRSQLWGSVFRPRRERRPRNRGTRAQESSPTGSGSDREPVALDIAMVGTHLLALDN